MLTQHKMLRTLVLVLCGVAIAACDPRRPVFGGGAAQVKMVAVAGTSAATIGCSVVPPDPECPLNSTPLTMAAVGPLVVDPTEVTVGQVRDFLADKCNEGETDTVCMQRVLPLSVEPVFAAGCNFAETSNALDDHPFNCAPFEFADRFCVVARSARLPTENEWEWIARGPSAWKYPWGSTFEDARRCDYANYNCTGTAPTKTTAAGMFALGESGRTGDPIYDLAGNVGEWTSDLWRANHMVNSRPTEKDRVVRGGSFVSDNSMLRAWFRGQLDPSSVLPQLGFRCVKDAN